MVNPLTLASVAILVLSPLATAEPNAVSALEHFKNYQRQLMQGQPTQPSLFEIHEALEINELPAQTHIRSSDSPVLVLVVYSRHDPEFHTTEFVLVLEKMLSLLPTGNFERRQYQLNDLHPGQARQQIWQLQDEDAIMRIEIVPGTSITVAFFFTSDLRAALHETRKALRLKQEVPADRGRSS